MIVSEDSGSGSISYVQSVNSSNCTEDPVQLVAACTVKTKAEILLGPQPVHLELRDHLTKLQTKCPVNFKDIAEAYNLIFYLINNVSISVLKSR